MITAIVLIRPLLALPIWLALSCSATQAWAAATEPAATEATALTAAAPPDLMQTGVLHAAPDRLTLPSRRQEVAAWLSPLPAAQKINLFGGSYVLHARFRHDEAVRHWVLAPTNTLIDRIEAVLLGSDGSVQHMVTGFRAPHDHSLHYGKNVMLWPGVEYELVLHMSSPYYASEPRVEVWPETAYRNMVLAENSIVLSCLGALAALAMFNAFIFALTRGRSYLFYALQTTLYMWGWAMVFHVPAELFGWHMLELHYLPFLLLPALSTLFCVEFLALPRHQPYLARALYLVAAVSVLLTPLAVWALPYAHTVATVLISAWISLAMIAGVRAWWQGWRPARFYVLAFVAVFIPALVILPANIGLIPDPVDNAELLTLIGVTAEGLLLALALADRIRLLNTEKDHATEQLSDALEIAHTDALTGIGNRLAFDLGLKACAAAGTKPRTLLFLIDLDGLKQINDVYGHARGDALIKAVAIGLRELLPGQASCYRLGGDEFALVARDHHETELRVGLTRLEAALRQDGFDEAGISYGVAQWGDGLHASELLQLADRHMYRHKAERKRDRLTTAGFTEPARL
jgi:diguanylate cyclase (GGDEF)-like protein